MKDEPEPKANAKQPKQSDNSGTEVESDNQDKSTQPKMSAAIYNLSHRRGISVEEFETMALDAYKCKTAIGKVSIERVIPRLLYLKI